MIKRIAFTLIEFTVILTTLIVTNRVIDGSLEAFIMSIGMYCLIRLLWHLNKEVK